MNKITHVLNTVSHVHHNPFPGKFAYLNMQLNDSGHQNILKAVFDANNIIESVEKKQGKILIHCVKGISRSASLVASHLMIKKGINEAKAIEFL